MTTTTTDNASDARSRERAIDRIIAQAERLTRDRDFENIWAQVYEPAKESIKMFVVTAEEYQYAIARLTEAMRV